jgi:Protein of unknown function (DUF3301)
MLVLEYFLLVAIVLAVMFWLNSLSTRELAIQHGLDLANRCNLQLLDETVACIKLRIARNSKGQAVIQRTFVFEVSANGADRMPCHLVLLGKQLQTWHIPPYLQAVH